MKMQGLEIKSKPKPCALCGADAVLDHKRKKRIVDGEERIISIYFVRCSRFQCVFNTRSLLPFRYSENVDTAIEAWDRGY